MAVEAPLATPDPEEDFEAIEIDIINPDAVMISEMDEEEVLEEIPHDANLADWLPEEELAVISAKPIRMGRGLRQGHGPSGHEDRGQEPAVRRGLWCIPPCPD